MYALQYLVHIENIIKQLFTLMLHYYGTITMNVTDITIRIRGQMLEGCVCEEQYKDNEGTESFLSHSICIPGLVYVLPSGLLFICLMILSVCK